MDKINILNKQGFLSDEDRKEKLVHGCNHFTFETCLDLSEPIKVTPFGSYKKQSINNYSSDVASFIAWWTYFVKKDLNGFSGFSNIKFELVGFILVDTNIVSNNVDNNDYGYLVDVDSEHKFVIANNISDVFDKLDELGKSGYELVEHKSIEIIK